MDAPPPSRKRKAAALLVRSGLLAVSERLRRHRAHLTVLAYHRVLDIDPARFPYDEDIVSATPGEFDRQMAYVRDHFDVLTFAEVARALADDRLPRRPLVVTFDDGYRDNCTEALPILRRHGLRAVVYVATDYLGGTEPFWYEKVAYWLKSGRLPRVRFGADGVTLPLGPHRAATLERIRTALKLADEDEHARLMAQLEEQFGAAFERPDLVAVLSWDEVRALHAAGVEIGSHSASHLNLAAITPGRLRRELEDSKAAIEARLGVPVVSLAYPIGGREHHNDAVKAAVREAGYAFGLTYLEGVNPLPITDRYGLRRIHVELDTDLDLFRSALQLPALFARE